MVPAGVSAYSAVWCLLVYQPIVLCAACWCIFIFMFYLYFLYFSVGVSAYCAA